MDYMKKLTNTVDSFDYLLQEAIIIDIKEKKKLIKLAEQLYKITLDLWTKEYLKT